MAIREPVARDLNSKEIVQMNNQANRLVQMAIAFVGITCALVHVPRLNAQDKRLVTADDLMSQMKSVAQLQLSPDGHNLAYSIDGEDSLWLLTIGSKQQPRALGNGFIPLWSPDGTRLSFYSTRSGTPQLWIFDLRKDETTQITNFAGGINPDPVARLSGFDEEPLHYSWSPDGGKIVLTSRTIANPSNSNSQDSDSRASSARVHTEGKPLVLNDKTPPWWILSGLFRFDPVRTAVGSRDTGSAVENDDNQKLELAEPNQIFIVDVESKQIRQLTKDDDGYFGPDWSPDGREIVCASNEKRPMTGYGPDTTNVYLINLSTGEKTPLTHGPDQKRLPHWSPDGKWIAYLSGKQFEVASLFLLPRTGGTTINVTPQLDRNIFSFRWSPRSDSILISYQDGVAFPIARVAIPAGKFLRLTQDDTLHFPFTVSRTDKLVWVEAGGSKSGVLYEAELDGQNASQLLDLNPQIREWVLGEQRVVRWNNGRGEELEGILIKPVGYEKGKSYPLIVDTYPSGGVANGFAGYLMIGNQAFASRGYAVFFPHERTAHTWWNPSKGKAFDEATRGPQGPDIMMDDLMSGIDTVVKMGVADPDRMCLYGFSNGGGATNMIVTKTTRFKCAVSASGAATDITSSFFMLGDPSTYVKMTGGRTPWDDPETYIKLSPIYHLDKVATPMLLAAGDQETAGTLINLEMCTGLRYLGRDVTFLRYPDQGHGFTGAALKDYWQRVNVFFDKYLKPDAPADPSGRRSQPN